MSTRVKNRSQEDLEAPIVKCDAEIWREQEKRVCDAFSKLCYSTGRGPETLFDHFLEYVLCQFTVSGKPLDWWNYTREETGLFLELFHTWVDAMQVVLETKPWYDFLGVLYETHVAGALRKRGGGQFFTPMNVCELMAAIVITGEGAGESISDPCCGSGRLLLAGISARKGKALANAKDLDRTCCLMTACNLLIHGFRGTVSWGNSLLNDTRETWRVNPLLGSDSMLGQLPHIIKET